MPYQIQPLANDTPAIRQGILFQVLWFAAVWGAAEGLWWLGPALIAAVFIYQQQTFARAHEWRLCLAAILIGLTLDSLLHFFGMVTFPNQATNPTSIGYLSPLWMIALWVNLALSLNHSLSWLTRLKNSTTAIILLGAISGPLSYFAGTRFEAIAFPASLPVTLVLLALIWGLALPVLYVINEKLAASAKQDMPVIKPEGGTS